MLNRVNQADYIISLGYEFTEGIRFITGSTDGAPTNIKCGGCLIIDNGRCFCNPYYLKIVYNHSTVNSNMITAEVTCKRLELGKCEDTSAIDAYILAKVMHS